MTPLDRAMGAALAAGVLAAVVWASDAPMTAHRSPAAVLRVAWSALPERVETCRQQSADDLARLPQHMRQPVVCEGTTAEYRLQVRVDGAVAADRVVRGGGLRQDRRLYVLEELALPAGGAAVRVTFDRIAAGGTDGPGHEDDAEGEDVSTLRQRAETVPPHLSLETRVHPAPRTVVLVTYDAGRRALVER